jgi:hypothetical protein
MRMVGHYHFGLARLDESRRCFCSIAALLFGPVCIFRILVGPQLNLDSADESSDASKSVGHLMRKLQQDSPYKLGQRDSFSESIGEEGLHIPDVDCVIFYEALRLHSSFTCEPVLNTG